MNKKLLPINSPISFADSEIVSFNFDDTKQILNLVMKCWNEKKIQISCLDVLIFEYKIGDVINEILQDFSESEILKEALRLEYINVPEEYPYKMLLFKDINEFDVIKIVCRDFKVSLEGFITN